MKKVLAIALLFYVSLTSFAQQADDEYKSTLNHMFKVSGTEQAYQAAIQQMFSMYKQQYTNVDASVWEEFEKEFSKTSIDDLTEMLVPVYQKYMTVDDLKGLIEFYETPLGKKYASNSPMIMQESMQIGQQWGMKLGQEFAEKMKEKGY